MNIMARPNVAIVAAAAILICGVGPGFGCALQEEPVGDGNPTFVYEVSAVEFTFVGSMKKLNCEALNFCSITWYKDGVPYPWKSSDHEHLEDRNQVLLIKDADFNDEGKYTCVVSNGKRSVSRSISLWVKEESYNGPPVLIEDKESSCTNHTAKLGQTVSFYCKFYLGHQTAGLGSVGWMKVVDDVDTPIEVIQDIDYLTKENFSENNSVISARLYVEDSKENAFGTWKVYAENGYSTEVTLSLNHIDQIKEGV
ncbi:interleukin-1 receptor accessory protein-like 1-B [Asterias rubens]|uniref:interleukin-1 receptor accessory protein-like 1-B n=1 Tax=Asterias rubens TaxID=7604 RepID=UPI00145599DC|nr:interleukin-1 receptor accessory protein-like 1-B [Asterias rubens]